MFICEDAADGNEDGQGEHYKAEDKAGGFRFNVIGKSEGGESEDCRDNEDMRRRERRLAGSVGAGIQN